MKSLAKYYHKAIEGALSNSSKLSSCVHWNSLSASVLSSSSSLGIPTSGCSGVYKTNAQAGVQCSLSMDGMWQIASSIGSNPQLKRQTLIWRRTQRQTRPEDLQGLEVYWGLKITGGAVNLSHRSIHIAAKSYKIPTSCHRHRSQRVSGLIIMVVLSI